MIHVYTNTLVIHTCRIFFASLIGEREFYDTLYLLNLGVFVELSFVCDNDRFFERFSYLHVVALTTFKM